MALSLPNLDDRSYAEIVEEAISQIQTEYPEWTDHNPTDTGIILIELLAWLTEMSLYQVNQIPDENYAEFVSLLKGETWELAPNSTLQLNHEVLQSEIKKTLLELRRRDRAVTAEDYEQLVLQEWNQTQNDKYLKIARVKCIAQRNLEHLDTDKKDEEGHVSLVVVPESPIEVKGLTHYYPLNTIINQQVIDKSTSNEKGNVHGSPKIVADSYFSACICFDGSNDYIELPNINFDYSQGFTISIWVYYNNDEKETSIIDFQNVGENNYIFLYIESTNKLVLDISINGETKRNEANISPINKQWHNLAVTVDGDKNVIIYSNGTKTSNEQPSYSNEGVAQGSNNYIGKSNRNNVDLFKGKMARMRMYDRALNYQEIKENLQQDRTDLYKFLETRKLLTTRLHIVEPDYIQVAIQTELELKPGAKREDVIQKAKAEVQRFFAPINSGKYWQGQGYPFGRSVYQSELYKLLTDLEGVDYVADLKIIKNKQSQTEINLTDNQLVEYQEDQSTFTISDKDGNEQ